MRPRRSTPLSRTVLSSRSSTCGSRANRAWPSSAISSSSIRRPIVVALTGYGSIATAVESMTLGAANDLTKPADADQIVAAFDGVQPPDTGDVPSLVRVEWEDIQRVLADCRGNISQAARVLGVHRRSLQRKLSRFPAAR